MRSERIARHKFKHQKEGKKFWLDKLGEVKSGENQGDSSRKGKFPPYGICKKTNHLENNGWQKSKFQIHCRYCKKMGTLRSIAGKIKMKIKVASLHNK